MTFSQEPDKGDQILVVGPGPEAETDGDNDGETVESPGKVMRIGSMIKQLLEEVRQAPLDEASRAG